MVANFHFQNIFCFPKSFYAATVFNDKGIFLFSTLSWPVIFVRILWVLYKGDLFVPLFPSLFFVSLCPFVSHSICFSNNQRLDAFTSQREIKELADPFATFDYLRHRGLLRQPFLLALCKWCESTATLTPTRSTKKPLNYQLLVLQDVMT